MPAPTVAPVQTYASGDNGETMRARWRRPLPTPTRHLRDRCVAAGIDQRAASARLTREGALSAGSSVSEGRDTESANASITPARSAVEHSSESASAIARRL